MNRNNLVGADKQYHSELPQLQKEFPTQDDLVVVVESENAEKNRQFVERLGAKLEAETNLLQHVFYKGDLKMLGSKALLFVPEEDLVELRKSLQDYRPFIEPFTHTTNLVSLFDMVNTQFRTAKREQNAENGVADRARSRAGAHRDPGHGEPAARGGSPPSPGVFALFAAGQEAERSVTSPLPEGRFISVTAQAVTEAIKDSEAVDAVAATGGGNAAGSDGGERGADRRTGAGT